MDRAVASLHTGHMNTPSSRFFRIYLVEDSSLVRERLVALLQSLPTIEIAGSSATVRQAIEDLGCSQPDMVILDLTLADGTGLKVLKYLKQHHPKVLIIIFTNDIQPYIRNLCIKEGVVRFLDKTTDLALLLQTVENLSAQAHK